MTKLSSTFSSLSAVAIAIATTSFLLTACTGTSPTQTNSSAKSDHGAMNHSSPTNLGTHHSTTDHSMAMDLGPADAEYDLRFIDAMIPHHQGAVEMAQAAQQSSQRPEIQKLTAAITTAQDQEIAEMKQWRQAWYPQTSQEAIAWNTQMGHAMPMTAAQKQAMMMSQDLGTADPQFDLRFINAMIPHHEGAVVMAQDALKKSQRPEIQQLAKAIIASQTAEISQMKQWRKTWYSQ